MNANTRIRKIRYKVILRKKDNLFESHFGTAQAIIDKLGCGLSKDIVYRKVKMNNTFTGFRKTPHDHIKIYKLKKPIEWSEPYRSERAFAPAGC